MLKKMLYPLAAGFFACLLFYGYSVQKDLSDELLRLHVVANSDSEYDQAVKLHVRDEILNTSRQNFSEAENKEACRKKLLSSKKEIEKTAAAALSDCGADYGVQVSMERAYIPRKSYDGIVLPEGSYESMVVRLGKAEGKNWWCVVYPPLCFTEEVSGGLSDEAKEYLKNTLSEESYSLITEDGIDIEYKFKIVELLQKIKKSF